MLIRDSDWNNVRHLFTESEKAELRAALTGRVICPAGVTIERAKVSATLLDKLTGRDRQPAKGRL